MAGKPKDEARSAAILARTHGPANFVQAMTWVWREMPVPVIAAVQGHALGGGIQIALACDMRFVTPDAKLSVMEMKWGLIPDLGATQLLWRLTRDDIARDLIYTGRTISGEEAFALGLATRVCADPRQEALSAARAIAMQNPDAIRAAKRLLNNAPPLGPEKGLLAESQEIQNLIGSPNQIEAVVANMEKRAPRFTDPAS
jgi:enoyl-CoA hydratase/carnithine racemase